MATTHNTQGDVKSSEIHSAVGKIIIFQTQRYSKHTLGWEEMTYRSSWWPLWALMTSWSWSTLEPYAKHVLVMNPCLLMTRTATTTHDPFLTGVYFVSSQ
jgi:hypothetical protein